MYSKNKKPETKFEYTTYMIIDIKKQVLKQEMVINSMVVSQLIINTFLASHIIIF